MSNLLIKFRRISLVCVWGILLSRLGVAEAKHLVTLHDLQTLRDATYLQLSPDGKRLAYSTDDGNLWLANIEQGIQRKLGPGNLPHWSHAGLSLAFYSCRSGSNQLWTLNLSSGRQQQITYIAGGVYPDPQELSLWFYDSLSYSWSPDDSKLVFTSEAMPKRAGLRIAGKAVRALTPGANGPLILTNTTPPDWTLAGIFNTNESAVPSKNHNFPGVPDRQASADELFTVDVQSHRVTHLTTDAAGCSQPDWSPDGQKIVCVQKDHGNKLGEIAPSDVFSIDIGTGAKTALTHSLSTKRTPSWSPDGRWIAFFSRVGYGLESIFVIPSAGGTPIRVGAGLDRNVMEFHWTSDSRSIIAIIADRVCWRVLRIGVATGAVEELSSHQDAFRWLSTVSPNGVVAWDESTGTATGHIMVRAASSLHPRVAVDLNPQIQGWKLGSQRTIFWKNNRGDELVGILVLPIGYQKGTKYPLIVDAYPHIAAAFRGNPMLGNQTWASKGYVVFFPNARAPHVYEDFFGSGQFNQPAQGPKGWNVTVDDLLSGVDELVRQGIVDPERIGLYGFSNGGGIVNYVVTRTNRFRCAVSVAGALADWIRPVFLRTDSPVPFWAGGETPWSNPLDYVELSAVFHLDRIRTPMLLADGDDDGEFLLDTLEMYNGLRWFGRDVTMLRYPHQGHGFTGDSLKDFVERELEFFDSHLMPIAPNDAHASNVGQRGGTSTTQENWR